MSAVIQTATPFVIESVLMTALHQIEAEPVQVTPNGLASLQQRNRLAAGDILTNRKDYNGRQFFRNNGDRWCLLHDSDEHSGRLVTRLINKHYLPVTHFLAELSSAYNGAYQSHLQMQEEQERSRLEAERKSRIEATRLQAINKAKANGYSVKEIRNGGEIQLILTRTV